jgi:hypothetical protein
VGGKSVEASAPSDFLSVQFWVQAALVENWNHNLARKLPELHNELHTKRSWEQISQNVKSCWPWDTWKDAVRSAAETLACRNTTPVILELRSGMSRLEQPVAVEQKQDNSFVYMHWQTTEV